jgi:DNA-binding transcriptional MerR regulator
MELLSIGEFAALTRLSRKALRLYDRLGLVTPAAVDPTSRYRRYGVDQVERARLVAVLRRAEMPLADIALVLDLDRERAAVAVTAWWEQVEGATAERRAIVAYLRARLSETEQPMYDITTRTLATRRLAGITRHVHLAATDAFFADAFDRLGQSGPGLTGIEGCPFLIFYGEVSDDSDGPLELCRPLAATDTHAPLPEGVEIRTEAAHDEAFIRLTKAQLAWPSLLPALDALNAWSTANHRTPAGPPRQVLFADQRTASPDTAVCDLSLPLR